MVAAEKGIKITATPDGRLTVEAVGFSGPACALEIGALAAQLSLAGGEERLKPEYFEDQENATLSQRG